MKYERIFIGLFALFTLSILLLSSTFTGMYSVEDAKPLKLKDKVYRFFSIEQMSFVENDNPQCKDATESVLKELLFISPHTTRYLKYGDEEGFGAYVYAADYSSGILSLSKGRTFVKSSDEMPARLELQSEEIVFPKYSDIVKSIKTTINITGTLDEDTFFVSAGELKVNGVDCSFSRKSTTTYHN